MTDHITINPEHRELFQLWRIETPLRGEVKVFKVEDKYSVSVVTRAHDMTTAETRALYLQLGAALELMEMNND